MKNRIIIFLILFTTAVGAFATERDSLKSCLFPSPLPQKISAIQSQELDDYLQYGFRLGTDFTISSRQLSDYDKLENLLSGTFGFFIRGGYRFIYGELGFNYMFYKGYYDAYTLDNKPLGKETVESRYFQIPFKVVGNLIFGKHKVCAFMPHVGIMYQPLIHVSTNDINYSKNNLTKHQFLYQAGLGFRVKFFNVEVAWKKAIKPFYSDRESVKQSYINVMVGFQF